jgi:hypothetical protein
MAYETIVQERRLDADDVVTFFSSGQTFSIQMGKSLGTLINLLTPEKQHFQ